ncbi:MAG: hypothetical protein PVG39_08125 [Desulfobacteraceae bacterium]|jgi:hypothetical protein
MSESKYGKYIITDLKAPDFGPEKAAQYAKFAKRILWMDENVCENAFQMNVSWYLKPLDYAPEPHTHDADEIIGFFSPDHENPYDLKSEIEFWIEDEKFILTKSCMIFIPGEMAHCPLRLLKVNQPIFHFTVVNSGLYEIDFKGK